MEGTTAIYKGRIVSKDNFRAFIYAPNGGQRLVESWDEFEANMQSGVWFATMEDAKASIAKVKDEEPIIKARQTRTKKAIPVTPIELKEDASEEESIEDVPPEDAAFEVKDDFLPKG